MEHVDGGTFVAGGSYEFGEPEERVIGAAARWVGWYSWIALVFGVLFAVTGIASLPGGAGSLALGLVFILAGFLFRGAAASMKSVVTTSGRDVEHLMVAMARLTSAFKVQVILTLLALVVGVVAGLLLGQGGA